MITPCHRTLLVLLPWCVGAALAQQPPAAEPGPAPAPNAEAMERARRDAANPMRVIIEAGRIQLRRRTEAAPAVTVLPPANPAAAPARAVASRSLAAVLPDVPGGSATEAVAAPTPLPAAPAESEPGPDPVIARPAPAEPMALAPAVELPAPATEPPPVVVRPAPEPAALSLPESTVAAEPTLVSMVEPVIPLNVSSRIGRLREVTADLTLRPDGRVAAVVLASGTPRAAVRYLTQALEQWRFEPLAAERMHRVQLVFGD